MNNIYTKINHEANISYLFCLNIKPLSIHLRNTVVIQVTLFLWTTAINLFPRCKCQSRVKVYTKSILRAYLRKEKRTDHNFSKFRSEISWIIPKNPCVASWTQSVYIAIFKDPAGCNQSNTSLENEPTYFMPNSSCLFIFILV